MLNSVSCKSIAYCVYHWIRGNMRLIWLPHTHRVVCCKCLYSAHHKESVRMDAMYVYSCCCCCHCLVAHYHFGLIQWFASNGFPILFGNLKNLLRLILLSDRMDCNARFFDPQSTCSSVYSTICHRVSIFPLQFGHFSSCIWCVMCVCVRLYHALRRFIVFIVFSRCDSVFVHTHTHSPWCSFIFRP